MIDISIVAAAILISQFFFTLVVLAAHPFSQLGCFQYYIFVIIIPKHQPALGLTFHLVFLCLLIVIVNIIHIKTAKL